MKLQQRFSPEIRSILFDIGNVLVDLDIPATLRAFEKLQIGGLAPEDIHPHQTGFFLDYELGLISDDEFIVQIRKNYECGHITDRQVFRAWNAMLPAVEMKRFELLRLLKKHYRLFVLSNTNRQHIGHLKKMFRETSGGGEFESFFECCFYSHEMHLRKPDPEIYLRVIAQTGVDPEEMLFIDDNLCNIPPADALLLKTHHLTGGETLSDLFE